MMIAKAPPFPIPLVEHGHALPLFISIFFFYFHFPIVGSSDEMVGNFHIAVRKLKVKIVLRTSRVP